MKKLLKWIIRIILSIVVLIVIAAIVLPLVIDPNDYKDEIENTIQQQIGRNAQLEGEIQWSVFPWLALTFNDVSIDNEKGFKGDKIAQISKLSASVKIMPLLSKDLQLGSMTIDDANFTLQVGSSGKSNWQSILDNLNSGNNEQDNDPNSTNSHFKVEGIKLKNIQVNYKDAQSKTSANISNLNLSLSEITAGKPVDVSLSMDLAMPDNKIKLNVSSKINISDLLSDSGMIVNIKQLTAKGMMTSGAQLPLGFELTDAIIDLFKDTLVVPEVQINAGDAQILTDIKGSKITKSMKLSGQYTINAFDLNDFLLQLSGSGLVTSNVLSDFTSKGSWNYQNNKLKLDNLSMGFADSQLTGDLNLTNLDKMQGQFNLHINTFNVDKFTGSEDEQVGSNQSKDSNLDFGRLKGNVKIDTMIAAGAKVENVQINMSTNGSKMFLNPVTADFYKGRLSTLVQVDASAKKEKVTVDHSMTKIQAGPLLTDLAGSELLTGIGDLNIDLKIDEPFADAPLKTAHGNIDYVLGNGAIYGVDVFGMLQQGLSLIYPELKQVASDGVKKTTFALMKINADINQGLLKTNTLLIESPYINVKGEVSIDLVQMTIDGTIEPMLLDIPEELLSDKYKKILNLPIPVSLSGSLLEPKISIDAKKLILNTQKEKIEQEKEKLKGKLLDSLFGKDKDD